MNLLSGSPSFLSGTITSNQRHHIIANPFRLRAGCVYANQDAAHAVAARGRMHVGQDVIAVQADLLRAGLLDFLDNLFRPYCNMSLIHAAL